MTKITQTRISRKKNLIPLDPNMVDKSQKHCTYIQYDVSSSMSESKMDDIVYDKLVKYILICQTYIEDFDWLMNCKNYSEDCDWLYQFMWIYTPVTLDFLRSIDNCIYCKNYSEDCDWLYQFTWIYTPVTLDFLCSFDFCQLYKNRMQKIKTCYEKMADQIEMSSAENIFGPVSKF